MSRPPSKQPPTVYNLTLRSQMEPGVPAFQKHKALVTTWSAMEGSWRLSGEPAPPGTPFDGLSATCKLTRFLPHKVKGEVTYSYRPEDGSETGWVDSIRLQFDPSRVAYRELLEIAIPTLLQAFNANHVYLYDDELNNRRMKAELRDKGYLQPSAEHLRKAQPVWFADEDYCSVCYELTCAQVSERLHDLAAKVECLAGGVYVIGSYEVLSTDDFAEMGARFENALNPPKKAWWKFW